MEINLSIIVPVYNLEQLLPKCLESILVQTFKEFELILVNDGSTDKSGKICDDYANKDERITVIHKKNGGAASSRNAGLQIAKGKYIGFVDSDDYINKFMYETLYNNAIEHKSDIVICDYLKVNIGHDYNTTQADLDYKVKHYKNTEALNEIYTEKSKYIMFIVPWNKLYRRSLFDNIKYDVNNMFDDETVAHKLFYNSRKITYFDSKLYYYVQRNGSLMNSSFSIKRLDKVYVLNDRATYFRNKNEYELHQKALKHYMDMFFWYYYLAKSNLSNIEQELKDMKRMFDRNLIDLLKLKGISWKQKVMCVLFSLNPSLFEIVSGVNKKVIEPIGNQGVE